MKKFLFCIFSAVFLLFPHSGAAAPLPRHQKTEVTALQKELTKLEKTLDELEKNFWTQYFCSKYSKDYQTLTRSVEQLDQRARRIKNRLFALQKQKAIPQYINLTRNCALEQNAARIKAVLTSHRLHGEWEVKKPMRLTSREEMKFQRKPSTSGERPPLALTLEDERYLLQVNHRLNYNLKYHFSHVSNHCKQYHDCRKFLRGGKLDARIVLLGQESSEYFDALLRMRRGLLQTETLLEFLNGKETLPKEQPGQSRDAAKRIAGVLRESRKLLDLVCDDFWCGIYFSDRSAKYQTLRYNLNALRNSLRTLSALTGGKNHLEDGAAQLLALLRPERRITFATDWSETGWTFLTITRPEAGDAPEKVVPTPCPKSQVPAGKGKKKKSRNKNSQVASRPNPLIVRLEKNQLEKYRKTVQDLQTKLKALSEKFLKDELPPEPEKKDGKKNDAGGE